MKSQEISRNPKTTTKKHKKSHESLRNHNEILGNSKKFQEIPKNPGIFKKCQKTPETQEIASNPKKCRKYKKNPRNPRNSKNCQ